jgi:hypothetical protein
LSRVQAGNLNRDLDIAVAVSVVLGIKVSKNDSAHLAGPHRRQTSAWSIEGSVHTTAPHFSSIQGHPPRGQLCVHRSPRPPRASRSAQGAAVRGSDLLIGGSGPSTLSAGSGNDILIAGTTAFDANETAPSAIMAEWTSGRDYATRIANLSGTGSGPRANGDIFLIASGPNATVFDNGVSDVLDGGSGMDWFFANLTQDILHGRH